MHQMNPMQIVHLTMRDIKTLTDLLEDHVSIMEEQNHAPRYTDGVIKAVKLWLEHFDIKVQH